MCKASAQRASKEQKLPQKQIKPPLIPPQQGLAGGGQWLPTAFRLIPVQYF